MRKKSKIRKSIKDKFVTALIDFLIGLILLIIDKMIEYEQGGLNPSCY